MFIGWPIPPTLAHSRLEIAFLIKYSEEVYYVVDIERLNIEPQVLRLRQQQGEDGVLQRMILSNMSTVVLASTLYFVASLPT